MRPPFLGLPYPLLDYLLSLPGDHAKVLLRVAQLARATPAVVDGIPLDIGEALISLRSGKVWGRVALDAEGLKEDGVVALRRRALARAKRDGWIDVTTTAHRTSTGNDTENGTRSGTPATIVRFLKFREVLWPASAETAHPAAQPAAQPTPHRNGTIQPASLPPEPPDPPEKPSRAPAARRRKTGEGEGADPRHTAFVAAAADVFKAKRPGVRFDFDGHDGKTLRGFLVRQPDATADEWRGVYGRALDLGAKWPGTAKVAQALDRWNSLAGAPAPSNGAPVPAQADGYGKAGGF